MLSSDCQKRSILFWVNAQKAAEIIEADGYAEDAAEVVEFMKIFFQENNQK